MSVLDHSFGTLLLERDANVLTVTLDDTDNPLNLFTWERMEELGTLMSMLRDEAELRAVLLTGHGRYFSGGGSFDLFSTMGTTSAAHRMRRASRKLYSDILEVDVPIVCAMNGPAHGAGASLVLLSDIVFAPTDVTLSDPHVLRGLACGDGAALWTLFLGPIRAKRFLLTGEKLSAQQAADLGMFTFVCEPEDTLPRARAYAHELAQLPPNALAHTKILCNTYIRDTLGKTFATGNAFEMLDFRSEDHAEAIAAFTEKRPAHYTGN